VRGGLVVVSLLVLAHAARADDVDDLVAQGEALAKQAEWSRAIQAFKAADAKRPRARHACLIGLAYTRRELWAEAELFLSICQQRARADDPAPDWLAEAQHTLGEKLVAAGAAPIEIAVEPSDAIALVSVSSFAPDETFAPRTIHLAPGTHVITATAPGYRPAKQEIAITTAAPQTVKLRLGGTHEPPRAGHGSHLPLYLLVAGGVFAAGGLAYDELAVQPAADKLTVTYNYQYAAIPQSDFDKFHTRQKIAIGMFGAAAALAVTGAILHFALGSETAPTTVSGVVGPHGGAVTLEHSW
jgi:hypothetical protein